MKQLTGTTLLTIIAMTLGAVGLAFFIVGRGSGQEVLSLTGNALGIAALIMTLIATVDAWMNS